MLGYKKAPSSFFTLPERNIHFHQYSVSYIWDIQDIGCQLYYTLSLKILCVPLKGTPFYWRRRPLTYGSSSLDKQMARKASLSGVAANCRSLMYEKVWAFLLDISSLRPHYLPQISLRKKTEEGAWNTFSHCSCEYSTTNSSFIVVN